MTGKDDRGDLVDCEDGMDPQMHEMVEQWSAATSGSAGPVADHRPFIRPLLEDEGDLDV